jgi:hypothetical protein
MGKLEAPCAEEWDEQRRVDDRRIVIRRKREPEELEADRDREGE